MCSISISNRWTTDNRPNFKFLLNLNELELDVMVDSIEHFDPIELSELPMSDQLLNFHPSRLNSYWFHVRFPCDNDNT